MGTLKRYRVAIISAVLVGLALILYYGLIREAVIDACNGTPVDWMRWLLKTFYPRFIVEQHRFEPAFFLAKADAVVYRSCFAVALLGASIQFLSSQNLRTSLHAFLYAQSSKTTFYVVTAVLSVTQLLIVWEMYWAGVDRQGLSDFYQPNWLNRFAGIGFPSAQTFLLVSLFWVLSIGLCWIKKLRVLSAILSLIIFLWMQGYYFGFEKTDHSFYTFFLAILVLPFYAYENRNEYVSSSWSLRWMQVLIAMVYGISALEKLSISGLAWFDSWNLQVHLFQHPTVLGSWVAQYSVLCSLMLISSFVIQLAFPVGLFKRSWMPWICIAGAMFHLSTWLLLDIGHWLNPWILVYVVFYSARRKARIQD